MASEDIALAEKHLRDYKLAVEYKYLVCIDIYIYMYIIFISLPDFIYLD